MTQLFELRSNRNDSLFFSEGSQGGRGFSFVREGGHLVFLIVKHDLECWQAQLLS